MADFRDEIEYPFEFNSIMIYRDHNECTVCGVIVGQGIINISTHWAGCAGKEQVEYLKKIGKAPLSTELKMDLIKKEFKLTQ